MAEAPAKGDVFRNRAFAAFWAAEMVSGLGSQVTGLALQVLVVLTLKGTATDVGLVSAARWLPYLLLGLVVGAHVDRRRRKPVLVTTDLGRAILLGAIPGLWWLGALSLPVLLAFVGVFGVLTLLNDAASQSFVPRLVAPPQLLAANARLDQGGAVAQTAGPLAAGGLIGALGAPLAVLADALSYLFSAVAIAGIRVTEPPPAAKGAPLNLRREIGEGLRWVYGHRTLAPFALSTHAWFVFNSMTGAVFAPFVLLGLHLTAFELGLAFAAAGVAALAGAMVSTRAGLRWGAGRAVITSRVITPIAWVVIACAPAASAPPWAVVGLLAAGQALYGFGMGLGNANEMGYRQAVTPDALQGRMNITMRSINRAMIVLGAPVGGVLADTIGYRPTLWIAVAGFLLSAAYLTASPFRSARHAEAPGGQA